MPPGQDSAERDPDLDEILKTAPSPRVSVGREASASELAQPRPPLEPSTIRAAETASVTPATLVDRQVDEIAAEGPPAKAPGRPAERERSGHRDPARPEMRPQTPSPRSNDAADQRAGTLRTSAAPVLSPPPNRPRFEAAIREPAVVSSEPAVQVTIGRIEIRAVTDPTPSQKDRADSPVMSLDDYLRSRAGGNRR